MNKLTKAIGGLAALVAVTSGCATVNNSLSRNHDASELLGNEYKGYSLIIGPECSDFNCMKERKTMTPDSSMSELISEKDFVYFTATSPPCLDGDAARIYADVNAMEQIKAMRAEKGLDTKKFALPGCINLDNRSYRLEKNGTYYFVNSSLNAVKKSAVGKN